MGPIIGRGMDPIALVVEHDPGERERMAIALEAIGFDVLACPGPTEPDYACVGVRTGACPLARDVDLVVMDARLARGEHGRGAQGQDLLDLYVSLGKRCVVLADVGERFDIAEGASVTVIRRQPGELDLVRAIRDELSA